MNSFKIEKRPRPTETGRGRGQLAGLTEALRKLKPGTDESILVEGKQTRIHVVANAAGMKVTTQKEGDKHFRVWRKT